METPTPRPAMPSIAIVTDNTLAAVGLTALIHTMMPHAEVRAYGSPVQLAADKPGRFAHYFVAVTAFMADAAFFRAEPHKTIVLVHGNDTGQLPAELHTLNVCQPEPQLVRDLLRLEQTGHGPHRAHAADVRPATGEAHPLTPREREVLTLIASGLLNKEIAARLNVGLTTVISHRKNLTEKLGIKNVSALTIYAVMHGLLKAEDI